MKYIVGLSLFLGLNVSKAETFKEEEVTFSKNIRSIFQTNCATCHPGLVNYKVAYAKKDKILEKITDLKKQMPPPYVSPRLSKGEVQLIKDWVNNGAKE